MNRPLICFAIILLVLPAFAAANTYTLRKAYSGRVVDGQNEIIFVNTTITLARGDTIKFQFSPTDKGYLYVLDGFSGKDAVFLTPSKELVTISEGTSKDFDSDGDGIPDLNIYAWRVYTTGATVYATPIREVSAEKPLQEEKPVEPAHEVTENVNNHAPETAPQENVTVQSPPEQNASALTVEKKNSALPIVLILLLTAVILVVIFLLARKKRRPF